MIEKRNIITTVLRRMDKLPPGHAIDVRSYKRDRSVVIVRTVGSGFLVLEDGFETHRFEVPADRMRKLLKTLVRREFPRSNKLRIYDLGPCDPDAPATLPRKVL